MSKTPLFCLLFCTALLAACNGGDNQDQEDTAKSMGQDMMESADQAMKEGTEIMRDSAEDAKTLAKEAAAEADQALEEADKALEQAAHDVREAANEAAGDVEEATEDDDNH